MTHNMILTNSCYTLIRCYYTHTAYIFHVVREADSVYAFLTKNPTTVQDTPDSPTSTWAVQDAKDTAGKDEI